MMGTSYRVPCKSVAPGSEVPEDEMCIIESMPVKSLITFPKSGLQHEFGKMLALRGHAWAGDLEVSKVRKSSFLKPATMKSGCGPLTVPEDPNPWSCQGGIRKGI